MICRFYELESNDQRPLSSEMFGFLAGISELRLLERNALLIRSNRLWLGEAIGASSRSSGG